MSSIEAFFAYARERHAIYLRRKNEQQFERGVSPVVDKIMDATLAGPWTMDPILQQYRFTNVFREFDRTTIWYRENVREKLPIEQMLLATVVFRWFNRIRTGEAIFSGLDPDTQDLPTSPWRGMLYHDDVNILRQVILAHCGDGPYVTGAYIIKTPDGYNKLNGVLQCIEWFMEQEHKIDSGKDEVLVGWQQATQTWIDYPGDVSLRQAWDWLRQFPYLGDFMAYEIVTDLRWSLLSEAPDIMTWANPGPGATRGIGRVFYDEKNKFNQHRDKPFLIESMQYLLEASRGSGHWPQRVPGTGWSHNCNFEDVFPADETAWPSWEMRDVEHTLCEFDKYERVRTGEGTPRGRFR